MFAARILRAWIGRVCMTGLAGLALLPGLGCSRLNLWEGPSYRDDPVVSDTGTSDATTTPGDRTSTDPHPAARLEGAAEVKTLRANR